MARRPPKRRSLRATLADRIGVSDVARSTSVRLGVGALYDRLLPVESLNITDIDQPSYRLVTPSASAYQRGLAWYQSNDNTGIQPGVTLTTVTTNPFVVTTPGVTFEAVRFTGRVEVRAANVTFRNCRFENWFRHRNAAGTAANTDDARNLLLERCEADLTGQATGPVGASPANWTGFGIYTGATMTNCRSVGMAQGVVVTGNARVYDSWIHDGRSDGFHGEMILSNGPTNGAEFLRNWLSTPNYSGMSGVLCMYGDFGRITNTSVIGNYLYCDGQDFIMYPGAVQNAGKPYPVPLNVTVQDNTFDTTGLTGYGRAVFNDPGTDGSVDTATYNAWLRNYTTTGALVPSREIEPGY